MKLKIIILSLLPLGLGFAKDNSLLDTVSDLLNLDQKESKKVKTKTEIKPNVETAVKTDAKVEVKTKVKLTKESQEIYDLILAEIKLKDAQYDELTDVFLKEAKAQKNKVLYRKAYESAIRQGEYKKSIEAINGWQKLIKKDLTGFLVYSYVLDGEIDKAIKISEDKIIKGKINTKKVFGLLNTLQTSWYEKNILSFLEKLHQAYPDSLNITLAYLKSLQDNRKVEKAIKVLDKSLFKYPRELNLHSLKASIYQNSLQNVKAEKVWTDLLNDYPEEAMYQLSYANFLAKTYQYPKALAVLGKIKGDKFKKPMQAISIDIYLRLGEVDKAEKVVDFAEISAKELQKAYLSFASILFSKKYYEKAQIYFLKADKLSEDKRNYRAMVGIAATTYIKDLKKGDEYFKKLAKEFKIEGEDFLIEKIDILQDANQKQEALKILNKEIKEAPKNRRLLYTRSLLVEGMGDAKLALADLEKILTFEPHDPDAQNALGYTLLVHTDNLKRAMKLIKKSLFVQPKSPAVVDSLGWGYYKKSEFKKSLKFLRYSYQNYNDGEVIGHYIMALYYAGEVEKAKKLYKLEIQNKENLEKIKLNIKSIEMELKK